MISSRRHEHGSASAPPVVSLAQARSALLHSQASRGRGHFLGTHTGEFLGMPASGKSVQVPYCVVYDLQHDKIAALRAYIPMDLFAQQLR
jgi:predicted ester cyclase